MEKQYYVRSTYYSCFGHGEQTETRYFTNVLEAWNYYKKERSYDFNYGDAWHETETVKSRWLNSVERTGKHVRLAKARLKRSKSPIVCDLTGKDIKAITVYEDPNPTWALDPGFDDHELAHLMSVANWGDVPFV